MMRVAAALVAVGFLIAVSTFAAAQTALGPMQITVAYGKSSTLAIAGATAAYPLDGTIVEASAQNGVVEIRAVGSGRTTVVVVTGTTTQSVLVTVPQPPVTVRAIEANGGEGSAPLREGGNYVGTYQSSAGEVTNAFDFTSYRGDTFRRMLFVSAAYVTPQSGQTWGFPLLSYEVGGKGYDVTYLDQSVQLSPLTFEDVLIRGLHVSTGPWIFHAGASTVAQFSNFFVPADAQWTAGLTRTFAVAPKVVLSANLYDIVNTPQAQVTTAGGTIGSLAVGWQPHPHLAMNAEVGLSRSLGYAASVAYDDATTHLAASLLEKPANFASLAADAQQGFFTTLDYNRVISNRFNVDVDAQRSNYDLPAFRENSQTTQANANYTLGKAWSVNGGALYSDFQSYEPTAFSVKTLQVPLGVTYSSRHFTAGAGWQPTTDFNGTVSSGYSGNVGVNYGPTSVSGYYNHAVDVPTLSSIFSEVPGLQAALEAAGINVTSPEQLAALLSNAALLAKLGFTGLRLDLAPVQNNLGFNANYTVRGKTPQQVSLNYLDSASTLTDGSFGFRIASLTYSRRIDYADDATLSLSYLRSQQNTGSVSTVSSSPSVGVTFHHRFSTVPSFLFPNKHGDIGGYVFVDDAETGRYQAASAGLAGVEVTVDGERSTMTDAQGHYEFAGLPFGTHRIEARMSGAKPYYFTTDSPASAQVGSTVDFGVNFIAGKLFGTVTNDAGAGVPGVTVHVVETNKDATTDSDGRFAFDGVGQGSYTLQAVPDSLPEGYDLATLTNATSSVDASKPAAATLSVRALRSVTGNVTWFDSRRGTVAPASGIAVCIEPLGTTVTTDANGDYAFRQLPAGTFAIEIAGGGSGQRRSVTLPAEPTTLTGIDFRVTVEQLRAGHSVRTPRVPH